MKAKLNNNVKLEQLSSYGFEKVPEERSNGYELYFKGLGELTALTANSKDRILRLETPMGEAAFMESHKEHFQDLLDAGIVELVKSPLY